MPRKKKTEDEQPAPPPEPFVGFPTPESNYFRLPTVWIDICAYIETIAELKVVQYILRHTWGYQEYGIKRKLTVDEFMHGRFKRNGERIDSGTRLSERAVRYGLDRALEHGFIEVEVDNRDRARIKKYYSIKMFQPPDNDGEADEEPDEEGEVQTMHPGLQTMHPRGTNNAPRSQRLTEGHTVKDKPYLSKGINPSNTKKEGTDSHIARTAIGSTKGTKDTQQSKTEEPKPERKVRPPITQDDIDRNNAQGKNASGFTRLGDVLHMPTRNQNPPATPPQQPTATVKQGQWKSAPLFIQGMISDWFSLEMHDQAVHSTITTVTKIYRAWLDTHESELVAFTPEQREDLFRQYMFTARTASKKARIKTRTPNDKPNYTPYFIACLKNGCGLTERGSQAEA